MKKTLLRTTSVLLAVTLVLTVLSGGAMAVSLEDTQENDVLQDGDALAISENYGTGAAVSIGNSQTIATQVNVGVDAGNNVGNVDV
jgi:hypothetical protein